jgi:predicted Zn-dependent protease
MPPAQFGRILCLALVEAIAMKSISIIKSSLLAGAMATAFASLPTTATAQVVKAADQAKAAQQHPQIIAQFGGAIDGPLGAYVTAIGNKTATAADLTGMCKFTVINSDVVNAFAVPGCYIYVTRGLLTIMNSEDELAAVLGHEIGHIQGKHAYRRQRAATLSTLGALALGVATRSQDIMQQAGQLAQMYTLSYSRDQENQSDDYGVQHLRTNGYNLYAASDIMTALGAQEALDARVNNREGRQIPNWARSHPVSSERAARTSAAAARAGGTRTSPPETVTPFFNAINGLRVGDDPEQGFINGRVFSHPSIKITFEAPPGFTMANSPQAVQFQGPNSTKGQFMGGSTLTGGLDAYANTALRAVLGQTQAQVGTPQATTVNGIPAVSLLARAQTQSGQAVDVAVMAYNVNNKAYHFVIVGPAGQLNSTYAMTQSMRILSDSEIAQLRPRQLEIVTVRSGDTIASLSSRMAYADYQADRFKMINAIEADRALVPGEKLKIVTYGAALR